MFRIGLRCGAIRGPSALCAVRASSTAQNHMSEERFDGLSCISERTRRALTETMGYELMTKVQAEALPVCCEGNRDVVAKAKTGTGKTIAFMVPTLERTLEAMDEIKGVGALVIAPTRELAQQTVKEGEMLSTFYPSKFTVRSLVGGVPIKKDKAVVAGGPCHVLVATPGRLLDHIKNTPGFVERLSKLKVLVFDEGDRLMDMGFRSEIEKILVAVKPSARARQTLMFSATLPPDVSAIAKFSMRQDYDFVDTVGEADEQTHQDVPQVAVLNKGQERQAVELIMRLREAVMADKNHKIMVFFTTAKVTQFYAELCAKMPNVLSGTEVIQIHSRLSQSQRQKVSKKFKESKGGMVMFTSDVSARGMDYPDVTLVIQFGVPANAEQYVHRLGRTARGAGARGEGCLLLGDYERFFLDDPDMRKLPIKIQKGMAADSSSDGMVEKFTASIKSAALKLDDKTIKGAYQAWLGYHNTHAKKIGWNRFDLVENANKWVDEVAQRPSPPGLLPKTVSVLGLKGIPGINVERKDYGGGSTGGQRKNVRRG